MLRAEDALQDGEREPNGSRSGIGGAWSPVKMRKRFRRRQREADFRARSEGFLKTEMRKRLRASRRQADFRRASHVQRPSHAFRRQAPGFRVLPFLVPLVFGIECQCRACESAARSS